MLACSFRTRSSSSFCGGQYFQRSEATVPHEVRGSAGQGSSDWAWGGVGWPGLLTFHPRRSARARQPWSQSPRQATSLRVSESQISQACPRPLPVLPCRCDFMPFLPPWTCPLQAPPLTADPGLTCRPSWSQSPCLLRGPSSFPGRGQSAGKGSVGGAKSTDP